MLAKFKMILFKSFFVLIFWLTVCVLLLSIVASIGFTFNKNKTPFIILCACACIVTFVIAKIIFRFLYEEKRHNKNTSVASDLTKMMLEKKKQFIQQSLDN